MTFDRSIAIECAELIQALYLNGVAPTINEARTDTQVRVQPMGNYTFVVFPGTASFRDGCTDMKFRKVAWLNGKVHRGFYDAYFSVMNQIVKLLSESPNVIICGHSLGGALATLLADYLAHRHPGKNLTIYTFGSPRVGNGSFARHYNANLHDETFRVVNQDDPVVRVPWLLGTYRHVGTRVFLNDAGTIEINPPLWRGMIPADLNPLALRYGATVHDAQQFVKFSAHSLSSYLRKLKA